MIIFSFLFKKVLRILSFFIFFYQLLIIFLNKCSIKNTILVESEQWFVIIL